MRDWQRVPVSRVQGSWTRPNELTVPIGRALDARNVQYPPGKVRSRDGHSSALTTTNGCTLLYNWITSEFEILLYRDGTSTKAKVFNNGNTYSLFTQTGTAQVVAEAGLRTFISTFNASGLGAGQAQVVDATSWPSFTADKAFPPRMTTVPSLQDGGAGNCSAGKHRIAYVIETRSGGFSVPCPQPSNEFSPAEIELTSGGRQIYVSIDATWPTDAAWVWLLYTTSANLEKYFWTGSRWGVPGGTQFEINPIINISDDSLTANMTEATEQFSVLSRLLDDSGPFSPSVVLPYGNRMVYIVDDTVYISDPEDYQHVTEDYHSIIVPGRRRITTAFEQRGLLYLVGPNCTFVTSDNDGYPSTWTQPVSVAGSVGTKAPRGVTVGKDAPDHGWVADEAGLFLFDGVYADDPISLHNSEWEDINWAHAEHVQVLDDRKGQRVSVIAPLGTATKPSHELVWHYRNGKTAAAADFSLDSYEKSGGTFYPGTSAMVQDYTTKRRSKWVAGIDAGDAVLKEDNTLHADNSVGISTKYRTALLPPEPKYPVNTVHLAKLQVLGSGILDLTTHSRKSRRTKSLFPITLSEEPDAEVSRGVRMNEEQVSFEVSNSTAGEWWELTQVTGFWTPYTTRK